MDFDLQVLCRQPAIQKDTKEDMNPALLVSHVKWSVLMKEAMTNNDLSRQPSPLYCVSAFIGK